jgi:hypothetical protein
LLEFGGGKLDAHPLRGLLNHGPHTHTSFSQHTPKVRLAIAGPKSGSGLRSTLLNNLRARHAASDRKDYVPDYPGFKALFGVQIAPASDEVQFDLPETLGGIDSDETEHI